MVYSGTSNSTRPIVFCKYSILNSTVLNPVNRPIPCPQFVIISNNPTAKSKSETNTFSLNSGNQTASLSPHSPCLPKYIMDCTQSTPFRLLDLPQELRDHIYSTLLTTTYLVDLPQFCTYCPVPGHIQVIKSQYCAYSRLAILRVSKLVHHEAKQILFRLSTFRFKIPFTGLAQYQGLRKSSAPALLLLTTIHLDALIGSPPTAANTLTPTISILQHFNGSSTPRSSIVIRLRFTFSADFLLEAPVLDALGKLTGFRTVSLKLKHLHASASAVSQFRTSTFKTLDGYLSLRLGPGEEGAGRSDVVGTYCLTYHPRGSEAGKRVTLLC